MYHKKAMNLFFVLLPVLIILSLGTIKAYAEDSVATYDVNGDGSITASLTLNDDNSTYTLTVTGSGAMSDFGRKKSQRPGWYAEYGASISKIVIGNGITYIGEYSFDGTNGSVLTAVELPNSLVSIGSLAFSNNVFENIEIPQNVTEIKNDAFSGCANATIDILGNNTKVIVEDTAWGQVGKTVKAFEDSYTVKNWIELSQTTLEIKPSYSYTDEEKTILSKYLAYGTDITIPDSVRTISANAFEGNTALLNVNTNNVTTVEAEAFKDCTALKTVVLPKNVSSIAENAFSGCSDDIKLFVNNDSAAKSFAEANDYDFSILKPCRLKEIDESFEKNLTIGDSDEVKLGTIFEVNYNSALTYQVKTEEGEYQDVNGETYLYTAVNAGTDKLTFRAIDQYGEPSDDLYIANYKVISNSVPVLNPEYSELHEVVLFGEQISIDLTNIFTDDDGDALTYKYVDLADVDESAVDWDSSYVIPNVIDGKFTTPSSWTQFPALIGKDHVFYVKAYDTWGKPSERYLKIYLKMHSANIIVNKGTGVHSLDNIAFTFKRDGAEDVTEPSEVIDNNYFFDLDYIIQYPYGPDMPVYRGGYDYTYEVKSEGCETINGYYTSTRSSEKADNTIEVTLSNPEQAEIDKQSVAYVKGLIDNLGEVTLDSEETINAAQKAYDALYDDLKPQVTNYNKLLQARLTLTDLKLSAALDELNKEKTDNAAKIDKLNQTISKLTDQLTDAINQLEQADDVEALRKEIAELEVKLEKANKELAEARKALADDSFGKLIEAAQKTIEEVKAELKDAGNSVVDKALKALVDTAEKTLEAAKAKADDANKAISENAKEIASLKDKLAQASQELAKAGEELAKAVASGAASEEEIAELRAKLDEAEAAKAAAEKAASEELAAAKAELAALKLTVKGLKVTSKKKKFTVKWKKNAKADGYRVQYKLSGAKKFKTLKTLAKTKVVSKKLKKGKKYEFRVATYKKVNGKKVFGKWTEAKIVKCK